MVLYSCGKTELWYNTAVGRQSCGTIQLWEDRAVVIKYSCGKIELGPKLCNNSQTAGPPVPGMYVKGKAKLHEELIVSIQITKCSDTASAIVKTGVCQ